MTRLQLRKYGTSTLFPPCGCIRCIEQVSQTGSMCDMNPSLIGSYFPERRVVPLTYVRKLSVVLPFHLLSMTVFFFFVRRVTDGVCERRTNSKRGEGQHMCMCSTFQRETSSGRERERHERDKRRGWCEVLTKQKRPCRVCVWSSLSVYTLLRSRLFSRVECSASSTSVRAPVGRCVCVLCRVCAVLGSKTSTLCVSPGLHASV